LFVAEVKRISPEEKRVKKKLLALGGERMKA
jgi:hypothetical protein